MIALFPLWIPQVVDAQWGKQEESLTETSSTIDLYLVSSGNQTWQWKMTIYQLFSY